MAIPFIILLLSLSSFMTKEPKSISLTYDEELGFYTVPVAFGSKEESFNIQADTTTSETWIPSYKTTLKVKKYNISESSTGQKTNKTFEVEDEDGDVRGKACYDTIKVGDDISIDHFGFVLVDEFEYEFKDFAQGKLGLGLKQEHGDDFNFVRKLKLNNLIDREVFSINGETKELVIGEVPTQFQNQLYTTCSVAETNDLDDEYRQAWSCELTHILFNVEKKKKDINLDYAFEANARVTFDSAYPYISFPKRHLREFKNNFMNKFFNNTYKEKKDDDSTYFVITDESLVAQASIGFVMEGYAYVIPSDKLFIENEDGEYEMLIRFYKENDNIFSFGNPFVNFFTIVYDYEEQEVGFYGGDRIEMTKEWYDYMNEMTPEQQKAKRKRMYIYGGVGFFLLVVIVLLAYRSKHERDMNRRYQNDNRIYGI